MRSSISRARTGAEPRLGQGGEQLRGAVVGNDCLPDVAQLLRGNSQAEICIGVARVTGDGPLERRDGIRYATDLKAGEAEIVLDDGIGGLEQRCIALGKVRHVGEPLAVVVAQSRYLAEAADLNAIMPS